MLEAFQQPHLVFSSFKNAQKDTQNGQPITGNVRKSGENLAWHQPHYWTTEIGKMVVTGFQLTTQMCICKKQDRRLQNWEGKNTFLEAGYSHLIFFIVNHVLEKGINPNTYWQTWLHQPTPFNLVRNLPASGVLQKYSEI